MSPDAGPFSILKNIFNEKKIFLNYEIQHFKTHAAESREANVKDGVKKSQLELLEICDLSFTDVTDESKQILIFSCKHFGLGLKR